MPQTRKDRKEAWLNARRISREVPWLVYRYADRLPREEQWVLCDLVRDLREQLRRGSKKVDYAVLVTQTTTLDRRADLRLAAVRKSARRQYGESVLAALLVALFIRGFLFEAYRIPSGSMIPTLHVGDYLFVSKFVYGLGIPFTNTRFYYFRDPAPGEVVIFAHPVPKEDNMILIKRVMAVAGDRIRMERNVWLVNGKPLGTTRVLARKSACLLSPDQTCEWRNLDDGPTSRAGTKVQPGCPCTFLEESAGAQTWITQRPWPGAMCQCSEEDGSRALVNYGDWPGPDSLFRGLWPLPNATEFPSRDFLKLWPDGKNVMDYMHYDDDGNLYEMEIPRGHLFVMGDNRDNSDDGRFWGVVPLQNVKGKALFIWWNTSDFFSFSFDRMFHFVH